MPGGSNFTLCLLFCCFAKLLLVQNQIVPQNYTRKQSVKHADKNTSISSIGHNKLTDKGTSISSTGSASYDDKNTSISSIGQNKLTDKGTFVSSTGSASNDDKSTPVSSTGSASNDDKSTPVSSTGSASNDDKSTPVSSTGSASNDDKSTSVSSTGSDKSEVNSTPETNIYPTTTGVRSTSVIQTFTTTIASEETTPVTTVHGRSCSNTSSCDDNMECWNSKCVCQLNHYWSGNNQTCLQIVFDSQINITNVANTSLHLRWTEPDLDAPVNGSIQYSVKWEAGGKVTSENVSTETSYNVQNLVPGENYTFSVVLIISDDGRSKNISSSLKNVTTVPDPPDSMNISSNFGPDITLTFSVTDGYISYCTVTVVGDDGFNFAKNTSENCTSLEVSGLENGTFYKVNVTAISGDKISMWKMFSFNTTASASEKVQSLIASSINFTTITVNWTRPNVTNGNITCYVILLNSTSDGKCLQAFVLSNDNNCANVCSNDCSQCTNPVGNTNGHTSNDTETISLSQLQPESSYSVTVIPYNSYGPGMSDTTHVNLPAGPSEKVQSLIASSINFTTITVNWTRPNVTNGNITCYVILLNNTSDGKCLQAFVLSNYNNCANLCSNDCSQCTNPVGNTNGHTSNDTETISLSQLQPESSYTVTVIPYNSYGPGMSDTTHVNLPAGPSEKVQSLIASSINFTAITVNWTRPNVTNGNITCYVILLNNTSDGKCLQAFVLSKDNNCTNVCSNDCSQCTNPVGNTNGHTSNDTETISISQLQPESSYTVTVIPYNSYGPGMSDTTLVNLPAGPSEKVQSLIASSINFTAITVNWTRPNVTNGNITCYVILLNNTSDGKCLQAFVLSKDNNCTNVCSNDCSQCTNPVGNTNGHTSNDTETISISQLQPESSYTVTVIPYNSYGPGMSDTTLVNLPAGPSEKVQSLIASSINFTAITVNWTRPNVTNGNITCYVILLNNTSDGKCLQAFVLSKDNNCANLCSNDCSQCTKSVGNTNGHTSNDTETISLSQLQPESSYTVTVIPYNSYGPGMSDTTHVNLPAGPSEKVQSLIASSINFTTITVNWTRPNVTNGNITCYVILLNNTSDGKCLQAFVLSNANNCANVCSNDCSQCTKSVGNTNGHTSNDTETISLSQLQPESSYTVTVIPYNSYGPGMSDTTHVNLPAGPSEKVQSLIASSINFTAITVNWTRPKVTNGNITCYVILLNDTSDGKCLQAFVLSKDNNCANVCSNDCSQCTNPVGNTNGHTSNDTETISISQLQPESSYTVTVIPYNSYGPGMSDTIHVNLPAGPSEKVSSFSVADVSNTTVTVIWTKPNVTNGDLTGYVLVIAQVGNDSRKTICFGNISMATAPYDNLESINDSMRYTANDIPPDTEIELTLYPINSAGNGSATTIRNRTLEAVPSILQNVTFQFLQNNIIEFKWVPPMPRPGVTNYSLTVRHSQKPYEKHDYEVEHRVNMSGWNTNRTVANYSYNGWEYQFQLDVFTAVGRPPPFVINISTPEAAPGQVQNLHVVPNENDFNSINVTWECPTPEERNGRIQNFTFSNDQLTNSLGVRNTSRTLKLENINCELKTFRENIPVYPGNTYIFQVFANNANFTGKITKYTYNTSIGRPPLLTFEIALSDISPTISSLSVKYCPACLVNTINGEIIYTAVVVCANDYSVSENLSSLTFINTMNTWHNASEENFKTIYRPTNESWVHQVQMNSNQNGSVAVFVVGSDENCWSTPGEYCNGPLPSGRAFKVAFVTCTRTACSPSNFSEVLWTAEEDTADMGAIVGGVLGGICAVAAVLGFVWYRRRQARKEHNLRYDPVDTETLSFNVRPVPMHDFKDKVQEWMSQEKNERGMPVLLAEQFKEIKELSEKKHSQDAALQDENKGKNRYTNILPYDHSRVKLSIHDNEDSSDFINANYIPGYHSKREYIATQGPLESTVNDFWQMVWEQQVPAILMLSGFMEGRTNKVHPYYPTDNTLFQSISYGAVTVMLKEVVETAGYTRRTFEIETNRQSRRVYHFYIKGWKDYDANLPVNPVLAFVQAVRDVVPVNSRHPLLVHCSAGVGRTGTIIGIDYFMHYVREKSLSEPIDIFRYVLLMREYRPSMVQSCEQYVFLHKAVAELVRRKKDPDHYDEPVYTNTAYEEDEHMYANC